ncbi:transglycosylase SLT domain-containing protein [Pasteurellaceae bacterium LIM206]|nr:transglycosylase SLT domain-containing protein [Pasteurellaceae bacterium LIM206]
MKTQIAIALTLFTTGLTISATAAESTAESPAVHTTLKLEQQRATYQKAMQLLAASQSEATRQIVKSLLAGIRDYPLYPYAEYQLLNAYKASLSFAEAKAYQQRHADFPPAKNFLKQWLLQQAEKRNWRPILDNAAELPTDTQTQCVIMQAKLGTAPVLPVISLENTKVSEKNTALFSLPQADLKKLWLTGNSLPKQCDPVLAQWAANGGLSADLMRQRALLAFEQKNVGLLIHLQNQAATLELKNWLTNLLDLQKNPQKLTVSNNPFNINKLSPNNDTDKRILAAIMPAYIKTLKADDKQDPSGQIRQFIAWANKFNLTEQQTDQWEILYLTRMFDSENAALQQWRDQELQRLKDDKLTERRIRMAIRSKADYRPWLTLLSAEKQNADEWQYWRAQGLKTQNQPEEANKILTKLSRQRGFYAMLAAAELGVSYKIPTAKTTVQPEQNSIKTGKNSTALSQPVVTVRYAAELARIGELRRLNNIADMNREWAALLARGAAAEKIALTQYAARQQWFDLQVEGTIQAKAWDNIALRLPNAYADWFDLLLQGKNISRTFAMAIARQESAWKPYVSSSANARGLMQLLPSTAKLTAQKAQLPYSNENQLFDPFNNIMLGTAHLQELADKFGDNRILIAAAYNAGANRVNQWLATSNNRLNLAEFVASIPFYETRGYVQNVLAYDIYYQILQGKSAQIFSQQEYNRLY